MIKLKCVSPMQKNLLLTAIESTISEHTRHKEMLMTSELSDAEKEPALQQYNILITTYRDIKKEIQDAPPCPD